MADTKISALPASTTPLAGTEVLPIVQSSTTKQVSVANLTAGRSVGGSNFIPSGSTAPTNGLYLPAANSVGIATNSANVATIDASGNLGLGVTPSAWYSPTNYRAVQVGASAFVGSLPYDYTQILSNTFVNSVGTYKYINTGTANYYEMINGSHSWYSAVSGTAGDTVSFGTAKMKIDSAGIVTMSAYGAGAATFSAAGVISSVSDETWKIKDGVPTNPDDMIQKLEPGYWFYNEEKAPIFGQERQLGFYAQNVHAAIGSEAAPNPTYIVTDKDGNETTVTKPWGYYDRSVLAVVVMSLKNALSTIEELTQRVAALENK